MSSQLIIGGHLSLPQSALPSLVQQAGETASRRYVEFFVAQIRNKGTRRAYSHAAWRFFDWCEQANLRLEDIETIVVAAYIEQITKEYSAPTVKLHLAAIRMLFDYLVTGHIVATNPAAAVRGPKYVIKKGKTPVLTAVEARQLLDSIETDTIIGLRDRALIGVMVYSFARVSATLGMNVEDLQLQGRRLWLRLDEKGGKFHEVPAHHNAESYLDAYMQDSGIVHHRKAPVFRTVSSGGILTERRMHRTDALRMIKRRAAAAELPGNISCHTFRASGITAYLSNGGTLEHAMKIAAHSTPRTTSLYDRRSDEVSLDEIERIRI